MARLIVNYYLGIDVGKYHHQAFLTDSHGEPLGLSVKFTADYQGLQELIKHLYKRIGKDEFQTVQAGLEATGIYWLPLYEQLTKYGIRVTVLNPLQVKACQNKNIRGNKTDKIDAALIAEILHSGRYKPSRVPNGEDLALRQLTRLRSDLVDLTTGLKIKMMGLMDQVFPEYKAVFKDTFSVSSRQLLKQAILPEQIAAIPTGKLVQILKKASRGRFGRQKAQHIQQAAANSIGITFGVDAFALSIEILLKQIGHLEKQIKALETAIKEGFKSSGNTLTTIPGVGTVIAAAITGEIGNFARFADDKDGAQKLVAIAGIDPRLRESGKYKGKVRMSKRGSPYLRKAVRQAAFTAVFNSQDPMFAAIYQKQVDKGKHFEVALSHVGRKLLHVVYSLLKSNKAYQPHI